MVALGARAEALLALKERAPWVGGVEARKKEMVAARAPMPAPVLGRTGVPSRMTMTTTVVLREAASRLKLVVWQMQW